MEPNASTKYCRDCALCSRPDYVLGPDTGSAYVCFYSPPDQPVNVITGRRDPWRTPCSRQRDKHGLCGPEGSKFIAKRDTH